MFFRSEAETQGIPAFRLKKRGDQAKELRLEK